MDLVGRDPCAIFDELCRTTGRRLDPCLLDTFIAAFRFMGGEEDRLMGWMGSVNMAYQAAWPESLAGLA